MSGFLKFAFEVLSQVVYNLVAWLAAFVKLFITGWAEYFTIFLTYFKTLDIIGKVLSVLLMLLLIAIPVLILVILIRHLILRHQLKADQVDNAVLYKEIGRLNKQVLSLMDEKNRILALKVNAMGGTERIPYVGASALTDDVLPTVGNVTGKRADGSVAVACAASEGTSAGNVISGNVTVLGGDGSLAAAAASAALGETAAAAVEAVENAKAKAEADEKKKVIRFPKLALVDARYAVFQYPAYDNEISLEDFAEGYRLFAASQLHLYYTPEIIRRFIAGMASSKILILEGISGTGKTSLPYSISRYMGNPATMVSVQPSFRDRTELLGYFNEFSKRFNETEFLRALYEAGYRPDPTMIVLDEMNMARITLQRCCPYWRCLRKRNGCWIWCRQPGQEIRS